MGTSQGFCELWQQVFNPWVQVFPCGCKFPHVAASFPMWVQVFNLQKRQDEILSPQETR